MPPPTDADVIMFYSQSRPRPPGRGAGEVLAAGSEYPDLLSGEFRKMFSDMYVRPFVFRGQTFATIEHVHHSTKYIHDEAFYARFTMGGIYGRDPFLAKAAGGKKGAVHKKLTAGQRRPVGLQADPAWGDMRPVYLLEAQLAKYRGHADLRGLLLATGRARLTHFSRGKPPIVCHTLMRAREILADEAAAGEAAAAPDAPGP